MAENNNLPVFLNLAYTTYQTPKRASREYIEEHDRNRAYFNMTGEKNIYKYMTTEGKRVGKFTVLEYLQKNTGVFDQHGMLPQEEVDAMKARVRENKGNIWHGFVSFNEYNSDKIRTPQKCIDLIKNVFPTFFREAGLNPDNIDLMCALHLDRPHHLHFHFVFWEKDPKFKSKSGELQYRNKGRLNQEAIERLFVRLNLFCEGKGEGLHKARDDAVRELRRMSGVKSAMHSEERIKKEILQLVKDLPKTGRLQYGSKDMEPFRERIDKIVEMLVAFDKKAKKADLKFYDELKKRDKAIKAICMDNQGYTDENMSPNADNRNAPKYHYKIDESKLGMIRQIEADYKRRQGNLVLNLCKFIKPEYFERKKGKRYKVNDNKLKRKLHISGQNVEKRFHKFFSTLGMEFGMMERDFTHRLQDIEKEIEQEREQREAQAHQNYNKEGNKKE